MNLVTSEFHYNVIMIQMSLIQIWLITLQFRYYGHICEFLYLYSHI
jgi:hypothetical protein